MTKTLRHTWEGFYPLIIYSVMLTVVAEALNRYTPIHDYSPMLAQAVTEAVCLIPMLYFYFKVAYSKSKVKNPVTDIVMIVLVSVFLSVGLNNLIALSPLREMSKHFNRINSTVYSDGKLFQILAVGICAPILEEVTFRGILFGNLRKGFGKIIAIFASALVFGAMHHNIVQFIYATGLGVAFAYIYEKTGALWSCILAHSAANLFSLVATWYGISGFLTKSDTICMVSGIIGCIVSVVLLLRWRKV